MTAGASSQEALEYERQRLENIRRNQELLASLALPKLEKPILKVIQKPKRPSEVEVVAQREEPRKSLRLAKREPQRTELLTLDSLKTKKPVKKSTTTRAKSEVFIPAEVPSQEFLDLFKNTTQSEPISYPTNYGISDENFTKVMKARIYSLAIHPGNRPIVAAGGKLGQLAVWDAFNEEKFEGSNESVHSFQPHRLAEQSSIGALRFSGDKLLWTCYDGSIRSLDLNKGVFKVHFSGDELLYGLDGSQDVWWYSDAIGNVYRIDLRSATKPESFLLHSNKIGTVSLGVFNLCTASNERSVSLWDLRKLQAEDSKPAWNCDMPRAPSSAYLHPTNHSLILSTCYDDYLRVHDTQASSSNLKVYHNCQTGRWITPFKAIWRPDGNAFACGSMDRCLMEYGLDGSSRKSSSLLMTSQPAVCAYHPSQGWLASGTGSGKVAIWTDASKVQNRE